MKLKEINLHFFIVWTKKSNIKNPVDMCCVFTKSCAMEQLQQTMK